MDTDTNPAQAEMNREKREIDAKMASDLHVGSRASRLKKSEQEGREERKESALRMMIERERVSTDMNTKPNRGEPRSAKESRKSGERGG